MSADDSVSQARCRPLSAGACRVRDTEMDHSCSDLEFFDFNNASEEEIKEIQAILKGPGSNGCVELPWEIPFKENCLEAAAAAQNEGTVEKTDTATSKGDKVHCTVVGQALHFTSPQTPLSPPVPRLPPPPVEAFVTPPTTIGPYANTPYFVSRTIPFVRAYPHMGVPFFACPLPGTGESSPMPTPYGQFVPMVPATVGQEKFVGQVENESIQKNRVPSDRQLNRRNKKKLSNSEYSYESENADACRETVSGEEQTSVSSPVSTTVNSDRPTSVPLVPLPVPPSTFGVASGTLPLHGYPPGLHTLPYTQMSGPQAPSAAMYYVPVFNHPYGSYIPSPPSAPMVLPVNLRPDNESTEINEDCNEEVLKNVNNVILPTPVTKSTDNTPNVQSNCEVTAVSEQCIKQTDAKQDLVNPTAKNTLAEVEEVTDCNSASDMPLKKSVNSSPDCIPEKVTISEDHYKCQPGDEDSKDTGRDASRCWADLFKKPCSEVNGIDRPLSTEQGYENLGNLGKEVSNGKLYSVPASDNIL